MGCEAEQDYTVMRENLFNSRRADYSPMPAGEAIREGFQNLKDQAGEWSERIRRSKKMLKTRPCVPP